MVEAELTPEFKTADFNTAVALSMEFAVERLEKNRRNKDISFVFKNSLMLQKRLNDFYKDQLFENPRALFNQRRFMKTMLRERPAVMVEGY